MFVEESRWIQNALGRVSLPKGATVLDIGSSTEVFRTEVQPHIDENVFRPLRQRELQIFHLDARAEPGVDIVANITLEGVEGSYDLVICANLLEHVEDRDRVLSNVKGLVAPGGLLLLTVPKRYPIHHDPIDTGFRPSASALARMVGFPTVIESEELTIRTRQYYRKKRWYRRFVLPWQVSCLLLKNRA